MWKMVFGINIFILCVNLTGSQDAQMSGEALFLGVPVGVFLEGISTWMVDWVEPIAIPSVFGYHSIHVGLKTKKKKKKRERERRGGFTPYCWLGWVGTLFFWSWIEIYTISSPLLRPSDLDWNYTTHFPGVSSLKMAGYGTSQPL